MFNISNFLDKAIKRINNDSERKKKVINSIKKITGIDLNEKSLEIKEASLYINTSQAVKNKLFINKKNILEDLKKNNEIFIDIS